MNATSAKILVADDEPLYLRTTGDLLRRAGYDCTCVTDANMAKAKLKQETFDLLLSDLNMPGNLQLELLHEQHQSQTHIPTIVVTGVPSLPSAIESIRLGIADYLLKPVRFEDLLRSVQRVLSRSHAFAKPSSYSADELVGMFPGIIGQSPPMRDLFEIIDRVAASDTNILITGESGTGKEVVAQAIHAHSHRNLGTFQIIDCTAVPASLFESMLFGHKKGSFTGAVTDAAGLLMQCDHGTAFFDEIGELPASLQAKLLRVIQEQTFIPVGSHTPVSVNTRFICATNRDLEMEVKAGRFRQDLFYRLGVIHIELPPLRARGDDVILLAEHFLHSLVPSGSAKRSFTPLALDCLRQYAWPGNIRELRNTIERALALARSPVIDVGDFPAKLQGATAACGAQAAIDTSLVNHSVANVGHGAEQATTFSHERTLEVAERDYLVNLINAHAGNVSEAARQAKLSRQGLHKLLKKHAISAADFR